jgi:hypothetical protein
MNKLKILTLALLCFAGSATAIEGEVISRAYELGLDQFQAPATPNSRVSFTPCPDCERQSVRVTPETRYSVNGKAMELTDFRKALLLVQDRRNAMVTVLHHLESDTVVSIDASLD